MPSCPSCNSPDTALVRTEHSQLSDQIALATTKFHLAPEGTRAGHYYCNSCGGYFNGS